MVLRLISQDLGHAALETTLIYTHLTPLNEARKAWAITWVADIQAVGSGEAALKYLAADPCRPPLHESPLEPWGPPAADAGPWTREPCDDVDPMPDYENVITD